MQRDVNPMFNVVVVLAGVCAEDRLQFQIKDRGLISVDRLGGLFGPRIIARASLPVGPSFEGFLELSPERRILGNGPALLEVKVRFSPVPTVDVGLPSPSNMIVCLPEPWPSSRQALQFEPSAPPAEGMSSGSGGPVSGSEAAARAGAGVPVSGAETSPSGAIVPVSRTGSGVPVFGAASPFGAGVPENTSSVFYIDPEVFALAPPNQILAKLFDMQERRRTDPFPATAGRNYNALGAGFDLAAKRHVSLWPGVAAPLPTDLDDVLHQMAKFNGMDTHPHWSSGVEVCLSWLESVKDPMHVHIAEHHVLGFHATPPSRSFFFDDCHN